jgi:uncharacterized protein YceH (UPF0502 family)
VLLLRGPQTPGELKTRGDRLHGFADLGAVHTTLDELARRGLVRDIGRRPGQKEDRWEHLLGEDGEAAVAPVPARASAAAPEITPPPVVVPAPAPIPGGHEARIAALEAQVAELRAELARLSARLDG